MKFKPMNMEVYVQILMAIIMKIVSWCSQIRLWVWNGRGPQYWSRGTRDVEQPNGSPIRMERLDTIEQRNTSARKGEGSHTKAVVHIINSLQLNYIITSLTCRVSA